MKAIAFYKPNKKLLKGLANEIKKLRKAKGLTIEQFSGVSGLHNKYLQTIERGVRNFSVSVLVQIAKALDISPSKLLEKALKKI